MPDTSRQADSDESLEARVDALERSVERLHERFDGLEEHVERATDGETGGQKRSGASANPASANPAPPTLRQRTRQRLRAFDWDSEQWLSRIGIGLLLFGIGFFFKFSVEQGWMQPVVRVGCGVGVGAALGALGMRVRSRQPLLGQVLMGGASAVLYATLFAAYQLYGLIGAFGALSGAAAVAVLTTWRSVVQGDVALAVVGALGALGAPTLLYTGGGNVAGVVGYTCLVLSGGAAVYFFEGWRALLYTVVIGGWVTFGFIYLNLPGEALVFPRPEARAGRAALQGGVVFAWLLFWSVPALREVLQARRPKEGAFSPEGPFSLRRRTLRREHASSLLGAFLFRPPAHMLAFSSPLVALAFSRQLWTWETSVWGIVALSGALVYALAYLGLRETEETLSGLAQAHGLVAAVLVAYGLSELMGGDTFLLAFAAEAGALLVLSRTLDDPALRLTAHLFFACAALVLVWRLLFWRAPALLGAVAFSRLGAIAIGVAGARVLEGRSRRYYQATGLALLLGWCWNVGAPLPGGEALATVSWGAVAVVLLARGVRRGVRFWRNAALVVIMAIVAKLFLVDLARLDAAWRVLLFVGFGGVFLLLSYVVSESMLRAPGKHENA